MKNRLTHVLALLASALVCFQIQASESAYPSKPIRMIVGFPPGGAVDILARIVGQKLTDAWGQQVVLDNRPGAGSTIAGEITAAAIPDGYTVLMITSSHAVSAGLYAKLNYHSVNSFAPVSLVATAPQLLSANLSLPARSIRELVSLAKASPGKLNFGSGGSGSTTHLAGELFKSMAGIDIVHIPYKGAALALTDVIGGQIQLAFTSLPGALPQVTAQRVKALAVTSAKRSPSLPEVPTIAESGFPGYEATNWYGILVPAGTPKEIINKLHAQVVKILQTPEVAAAITRQGAEPEVSSPQAFGAHLKSEIAKWTKVIREAGIRPN